MTVLGEEHVHTGREGVDGCHLCLLTPPTLWYWNSPPEPHASNERAYTVLCQVGERQYGVMVKTIDV